MKEKKQDIVVSQKHVKLRIIIFILLVLIAVGAFFFALRNIKNLSTGYQELEADLNDTYPDLNNYLTTYYYMEGSASKIRTALKQANSEYNEVYKPIYAMLDEKHEYSDVKSIGYLNNHLGDEVEVDPVLYQILADAYAKTLEKQNYNLFANLLYDFWNGLFSTDHDMLDLHDPLFNQDNANYLAELVNLINDLDNFSLSFNEARSTIIFDVSIEFKTFLTKNNINEPIMSLNALKDSYLLTALTRSLSDKGWKDFYIVTENMVFSSYEIAHDVMINFFKETLAYDVLTSYQLKNSSCAILDLRFKLKESDDFTPFYKIEGLYRSLNLNLSTGYPEMVIKESLIIGNDLIEIGYFNNYLNSLSNKDDVQMALLLKNYPYCVMYQDNTIVNELG